MENTYTTQKKRIGVLAYKYSLLLFFIFSSTAFYVIQLSEKIAKINIVNALLNAALLMILYLFLSRIPKFVSYPILVIVLLLTVVPITYRIAYTSLLTPGIIASIFETNRTEAAGIGLPLLWIGLPIFLVLGFLSFVSLNELKSLKVKFWKIILIILGFSAIVIAVTPFFLDRRQKVRFKYQIRNDLPFFLQNVAMGKLPFVVSPTLTTIYYNTEMSRFRENLDKKRIMPDYVKLNRNAESLPNTIFIIIGESSVQDHYSLYGYNINTTPFLDTLNSSGKLFYYDAISPAPYTRDAIRLAFTFATAIDKAPFFDNVNNVELANYAGYKTHWISNQNKVGIDDSYIGMIASNANTMEFFNYHKDDLELVEKVKISFIPEKKQVFYIHLKGSHQPYNEYDDTDVLVIQGNSPFLDYDRTIHHTDRVISKLYNEVSSKTKSNALIYYFSDHGEIVNEGHGSYYGGAVQFRIPFVVIPVNCTFDVDVVVKQYFTGYYFNTVNLNYVLAESMGYIISPETMKKAIEDGKYIYHIDDKAYIFSDNDKKKK